jgi:hypothetical protein
MPIQRDDEQDLKWLVVGHYAAAAMTLLAGLFFAGFFLLMGRFIQAAEQSSSRSDRLAAEFGQRFTEIIGASTAVYFLLIAGALISVGVLVSRRRSYRLCLGLSALNATSLAYWCPFGPIAAAFTCRLLRRPSIQVQFADNGFPKGADSRTVWDLQAISLGCYVLAGYMGLSSLVGVATMTWVMNLVPEAPNAEFAKTLMIGIALVVSAANTAAFGVLGFCSPGPSSEAFVSR